MPPVVKEFSDPDLLQARPTVSVAMLAYNHAPFIAEAIEGVAMQKTDFPVELVIGVDISSDNTLEIVLDYRKRYPKLIRALVADERLGCHGNAFQTLEACRGKYIAMCEGDDFWTHPEKLARQAAVLEAESKVAGVYHDCHILNQSTGNKRLRVGSRAIDQDADLPSLLRERNIATCSMFFRNVLPWNHLRAACAQVVQVDYMLALDVARHGVWRYLPEPMAVYRVHAAGMWSGMRATQRWKENIHFWQTLEAVGALANAGIIRARKRDALRGLGIAFARDGKLCKSFACYLRSLGPRRTLNGRSIPSSKYLRQFANSLAARLGVLEAARAIRRKAGALKRA
jgi:glycosyltransferase involved in cell wall biosynthesis